MSIWEGLQSVAFHYLSCAPCHQVTHRRKAKLAAKREHAERAVLEREQPGLYRHPSPFSTNPYWQTEIAMGPSPPTKKGKKNKQGSKLNAGNPSGSTLQIVDNTTSIDSVRPKSKESSNGRNVLTHDNGTEGSISTRPSTKAETEATRVPSTSRTTSLPLREPEDCYLQPASGNKRIKNEFDPTLDDAKTGNENYVVRRTNRRESDWDTIGDTNATDVLNPSLRKAEGGYSANKFSSNHIMYDSDTSMDNANNSKENFFTRRRAKSNKSNDAETARVDSATTNTSTTTTNSTSYPYFTPKSAPVNDLHPPIVSKHPISRGAAAWMMEPPPSAKVMQGKVQLDDGKDDDGIASL